MNPSFKRPFSRGLVDVEVVVLGTQVPTKKLLGLGLSTHELLFGSFRADTFVETLIGTTMSMITASLWVPRGAAAAFPEKYDIDEDELARISKLAKLQLEDAKEDLSDAKNGRQGDTEAEESDAEEDGVKLGELQA